MKRVLLALLLLALCLLLCGCEVFVEKSEGTIPWAAETVLIDRWGDGRCLLLTDPEEISALQETYRWANFHLECCLVLPLKPEREMPRSARVVATCVTVLPEDADFHAWMGDYDLGEFAGDATFLPLQEALAEAGVLRDASRTRFTRSGDGAVTRQVTFYVTDLSDLPDLSTVAGLTLTYHEADSWTARIVTPEKMTDADRAALQALGVTLKETEGNR